MQNLKKLIDLPAYNCDDLNPNLLEELLSQAETIKSNEISIANWKTAAQSLDILKIMINIIGKPAKEILNELLTQSAKSADYELAQYLLELGALPNVGNCRTLRFAKLFLSYGGDIDQKGDENSSLLRTAVSLFDEELIDFALKNGATINFLSDDDRNPPLELTGSYYTYCHVSKEKKQKIQNLFFPYILKQNAREAFLFLLSENYDFSNPNIYNIIKDNYEKIVTWITEYLATKPAKSPDGYDEYLRSFCLRAVAAIHPEFKKLISLFPEEKFTQFSLALLDDGKSQVIALLNKFLNYTQLISGDTKQRIKQLIKLCPISNQTQTNSKPLTLDASIEEHAAYLFNQVYSNYYPNTDTKATIARYHHGMMHASRAAIYIPVFLNLYKKYGDLAAQHIPDEDIKLIQIAAFLHDAGRQGEGVDYWDNESGLFVYVYLKKLGVEHTKAKLLAEAVANKDPDNHTYHELIVADNNKFSWQTTTQVTKNIYQKLIHDVDCLDIIRVRDKYKYGYLDFYNQIADHNLDAFTDMKILIGEAKNLIRLERNHDIKEKRECEDGYRLILNDINENHHSPLLQKLYTPHNSLTRENLNALSFSGDVKVDPENATIEDEFKAALLNGQLFARGINKPSQCGNSKNPDETNAQLELRKTARRRGNPTHTKKANNKEKQGNPNRSISMIGFGRKVFAEAGYLIKGLNESAITSVAKQNATTGTSKKEGFRPTITNALEANKKLISLKYHLIRKALINPNTVFPHVELTYNLEDYHGVYYTASKDETLAFLKAVYLQREYKNLYGKKIPIFCYSVSDRSIRLIPEKDYADETLKNIWVKLCREYIDRVINEDEDEQIQLAKLSATEIKRNASDAVCLWNTIKLLDSNYANSLIREINTAVEQSLQDALVKKHHDLHRKFSFLSFTWISRIYVACIESHNVPNLSWIKNCILNKDHLYNILVELPMEKRLGFLLELGPRFLTTMLDRTEIARCSNYLVPADACLLRGEFDRLRLHIIKADTLIDAIKAQDRAQIESSVIENPNILAWSDVYGFTPLHWAAICGDIRLVKFLLEQNADPFAVNRFGENSLHLAAWYGHTELVKFFLANGFDPNQKNMHGKSAIDGAIEFGYCDVFDCLIKAGAKTEVTKIPYAKRLSRYVKDENAEGLKELTKEREEIDNETKIKILETIDFNNQRVAKLALANLGSIKFNKMDADLLQNKLMKHHPLETFRLLTQYGLDIRNKLGYHLIRVCLGRGLFNYTKFYLKHGAPLLIAGAGYDDIIGYVKQEFHNRHDNQIFLEKLFDVFIQTIFEKNTFLLFKVFLKHLDHINLAKLHYNKLTRSKLDAVITSINEMLDNKCEHSWIDDKKELQLKNLIETLKKKIEQSTQKRHCLFQPNKPVEVNNDEQINHEMLFGLC